MKRVKEYILTIGLAVGIALAIRHFVLEPFRVPNLAMQPNLVPGDTLFVLKWGVHPVHGQMVIYSPPTSAGSASVSYIRRVVALPGDWAEMKAGHVYINDRPIDNDPKKLSYSFQIDPVAPPTFPKVKVPLDSILVAADFRSQVDAKKNKTWSIVPTTDVKGRPWLIWLSIDYEQTTSWLPSIRWDRIFQKIE